MRICYLLLTVTCALLSISACSDSGGSSNKKPLLFTANKDNINATELYVVTKNNTAAKISADLVSGGNVVEVSISPDETKVAYIADGEVDGRFELFVMTVAGSPPIKVSGNMVVGGRVIDQTGFDSIFWSPDSTKVAYVAYQNSLQTAELFVSSIDGNSNIKVSGPQASGSSGVSSEIHWSPDSSLIAYTARQDDISVNELYVSTADGLTNRKISGAMVAGGSIPVTIPGYISWSPDGNYILYLANQDDALILELYISTADGVTNNKLSGPMVVGDNVMFVPAPIWSPDSTRIAYLAYHNNTNATELFANTPAGSNNIKLSGTMVTGGNVLSDVDKIGWSPDGTNIFYIADQVTDNINELFVSSADGSGNNKVSDIGFVFDAVWSPDGSYLAYSRPLGTGSRLYAATADGTTILDLTTNAPDLLNLYQVTWSPDNSKIAYVYFDTWPSTTAQLQVASIDQQSSDIITNTLVLPTFDIFPLPAVKWLDDGSTLSYIAQDGNVGVNELFSIEGTTLKKLSGIITPGGGVNALF